MPMLSTRAKQPSGGGDADLFDQKDQHGDRQQGHCGDQNVVAPAGDISKHTHSPGKSRNSAAWEGLHCHRTLYGCKTAQFNPGGGREQKVEFTENQRLLTSNE
jgi:hypothetical protein